ncbi:MAG: sigma-54-dependent Fis family transcriptional regulator [Bdellovibrionales bacterium]|nr:sigma-54-dependent Fis family transcriptional regulator [Bdellovibrionales bacterium]
MSTDLQVVQEDMFAPAFMTRSAVLTSCLGELWKLARSDTSLFFCGESGTGKTLLAEDVHNASARAGGPFVVVDCTSLPAGLIESELFGHVKGAFTSAVSNRCGLISAANGGTVFLDEISELPSELQAKLLRVVQHGRLRPVGTSEEQTVDVRWICATHADIPQLIEENRFRVDLFYRLCQWTLTIPALRDRPEDIKLHAEHFFARRDASLEERCTDAAVRKLLDHRWPGNVRELESVLGVADVLVEGRPIEPDDLALNRAIHVPGAGSSAATRFGQNVGIRVGVSLDDAQRALTQATLRSMNGNITAAALQLGTTPRRLSRLLKQWNLQI